MLVRSTCALARFFVAALPLAAHAAGQTSPPTTPGLPSAAVVPVGPSSSPAGAGSGLILNGDFDVHSLPTCATNLTNAEITAQMPNVSGIGDAEETDVLGFGCYGLDPISGTTKIALHRQSVAVDALALELSAPTVAGQTYTVGGWLYSDLTFDPGIGALEIGLGDATTFGTLVATAPSAVGVWTEFSMAFVAPVGATHLTIRVDPTPTTWLHLDALCLGPGSGCGGVGTNYCDANANSTGVSATMSATGSASVSANDTEVLAHDLPVGSFAFFIVSQSQGFVPNPGGSQGNLCLGGAIGRFVGPGQILQVGPTGSVIITVDLTQIPQPTGSTAAAPGDSWSFQSWYRDSVGGSATSNFTDGLEIVFL